MKKIVKGNDFTLRIPVMKVVDGERVAFPLPSCTDVVVRIANQYKRVPLSYTIDVSEDNVILAKVEGDQISLGTYAVEVKGRIFGNDWRSNEYPQFQIVANNADADTEFSQTDEGDNSVEMDTALVILPPTVELSNLIGEATESIKAVNATDSEVKTNEEARKASEEGRVKSEESRATAETARVKAEAARVDAESSRVSAETARVSVEESRAKAEQTREDNEATRKTNESARISAESTRKNAEDARQSSELVRVSNEDLRKASELARVESETARKVSEQERADAEQSRKDTESSRVKAEESRSNAEQSRDTAEQTRKANETDRINAESQRSNAETDRKQAETDRITAESARQSKETLRVSAEATRQTAEKERQSEEGTRQGNEVLRQGSETARESNESARKTAETARTDAETARVTAETKRATAEEARTTAETKREADCKTAISNAEAATTKAESATTKANTAATGAEKVNATIDGSTIKVTDRNGDVKTYELEEWAGDENVTIQIASDVEGFTLAGHNIFIYFNGSEDAHATYTTDENGKVTFTATHGSYYKVVYPDIADCDAIPSATYVAVLKERNISVTYNQYSGDKETVIVYTKKETRGDDGTYTTSGFEGVEVTLTYDEATLTQTTDANGTATFEIPLHKAYTVKVSEMESWHTAFSIYEKSGVSESSMKDYYFHYYEYRTGVFIVDSTGKDYTSDEWTASGKTADEALLVKLVTHNLMKGSGVFGISIAETQSGYPNKMWCESNVQFTSIAFQGNTATDSLYYNGDESTTRIIEEGESRSLQTPAATYCRSKTIEIGGVSEEGYLPAIGQWMEFWSNITDIDNAIKLIKGDSAKTFNKNYGGNKWSTTQVNAADAWYFTSAPNNYIKRTSYLAVPFYAC